MIKLSLVSPVYNSHFVFREQIIYLSKILNGLDGKVEVIFVDDGSWPKLIKIYNGIEIKEFNNFKILRIDENIPWNQLTAANLGGLKSKGEYILFFDIDHIITLGAIKELLKFKGDMIHWKRVHGVLEKGQIITNAYALLKYNTSLNSNDINKIIRVPFNVTNTFGVKRKLFLDIGGYKDNKTGKYTHEDQEFHDEFNKKYNNYISKDNLIYVYPYPASKENEKYFHSLSRE
ncbi:MAG: glycosyltransferase [Candidatus Thorarchaeota archaeon]